MNTKKLKTTQPQIDFIKSNYATMTEEEMSKETGLNITYLRRIKADLKLKRRNHGVVKPAKIYSSEYFDINEFKNWAV